MKNINKLIVLLVSVFLLSSCGSLSISQKRYSNGLNIDWFSKKEEKKEIPQTKANKKKQAEIEALANKTNVEVQLSSEEITTTEVVESTEVVEQENVVEPAIEESVKATQFSKSSKPSKQGIRQVRKQTIQTLKKDIQAKKSTLSPNNSNKTNELDVLLLIIIAIFIPPLAVYLFYGSPETHFWINLILFLVFGGLAFSGGFYGWAGIAFIHALLVILGVIG
jgi:uncharacterized membrane protein YqaE (UPF0057 family)